MIWREFALAFSVVGKLSGEFKKTFDVAGKAICSCDKQMKAFNASAKDVSGLIKSKQAVMSAMQAHAKAKEQLKELLLQSKATGAGIRNTSKDFEAARMAVKRTASALKEAKENFKAVNSASAFKGMSIQQLKGQQGFIQQRISGRERYLKEKDKFKDHQGDLMVAGAYAADAIKSIVSTGMQFEQEMARVGAVSRASGDSLARMTETAKDLGEKTVWSASQAAQGMQYLAMAGFDASQVIDAMPGMLDLASAGAIELGQAADIASNILTGFGLNAKDMGHVGDVLTGTFTRTNTTLESLGETMKYVAPVAKNLGVSLEQASAMAGALGNAGLQGSEAGTALRSVMLRLSAPPSEAAKAMKQLGIRAKDAQGNMRPMGDVLAEIGQKMQGLPNGKVAELSEMLYGKNAVSGGMVLQAAAAKGELQQLTQAVNDEGAAARVAAEQNKTASGQAKAFSSAVERFKINAFYRLAPILETITKGLTGFVKFMNELDDVCPGVSTALYGIAAVAGVLAVVVPVLTVVFGAWSGAISGVNIALVWLSANPAVLAIAAIVAIGAALYLLITHFDDVMAAIGVFGEYCKVQWNLFVDNFYGLIDMIVGPIREAWNNAWIGLKNSFGAILNGIKRIALNAINGVIDIINTAIGGINSVMSIEIAGKSLGVTIPKIPQAAFAKGGIVTGPTIGLIGEGRESEAVLPLSKLDSMLSGSGAGTGEINVSYVINVNGGGDAYNQVKLGIYEGTNDLKRQLEQLMANQRRLSYA